MAYGDGFDDSYWTLSYADIAAIVSSDGRNQVIIEFKSEVPGVYSGENITTTATNW